MDALVGLRQDHALAGAQFVEGFDIFLKAVKIIGVNDLAVQVEGHFLDLLFNHLRPADQDRDADAFLHDLGRGADDLGLFAFAKGNALLRPGRLGLVGDEIANAGAFALAVGQLQAIFVNIDHFSGNPGLHGRLGDRSGFPQHHAHIQRLGDDVIRAELQAVHAIGAQDIIWHIFAGQVVERLGGGKLHFLVDRPGAHIQRTAEDEWESQHVVDLVRVVGTASGDDDIRAGFLGQFIPDLGIRIRHRANKWTVGHGLDHFRGEHVRHRETVEHICAAHGICQRAQVRIHRKPK